MSAFAQVTDLAESGQAAMRAGRHEEAARAWSEVLALEPAHGQALFHLGQHALMRRDIFRARELLERAAAAAPKEPAVALNLAFVYRATGDTENEMAALIRALAIDPYFYPALLAKAMLLERMGRMRQSARVYKDVLSIAPADDQLAPEFREPMRHARRLVEENADALAAHLAPGLQAVRARHGSEKFDRFDECRDIALGRKRAYTQQPSMLLVPRLPAIPFYDRTTFQWLALLEEQADAIRDELLIVLREDTAEMRPYVAHPDGVPINQWAELNHSPRWSAFFLWEDGRRIDAHCTRCPKTAALLERIPMMDLAGYAPTVLFSILSPHTHIPPHSSVTNARLVVHLPLIAPAGCRFRVGNETRDWRYGEAWVFDDTIDHEAWNDSDQLRVIMMIDIWNPLLTLAERESVTVLLRGIQEFYGDPIPRP